MAKKKPAEKSTLDKIFEAAQIEVHTTPQEPVAVPAVSAELVPLERSTRKSRQAQLMTEIENGDIPALAERREMLNSLVSLITADLGEDPVLNEHYALVLMQQAIAMRDLKDLQELVWERVKQFAFDHFNASLAEKGHPDPENVNAILEVTELGMKLCREAAGYTDSEIDDDKLREALGKDWRKVYTRERIPARVVYNRDDDALWRLIKENPALLEAVRVSGTPGVPKKGRLNLRNI